MKIMKNILLLFTTCIITVFCFGQVTLTNTGTLYVSGSSDILYVNGSFSNNSGSALTNNGSLYVSQTLTNNQASMATGTGSLYLNGSTSQSITGSQTFKTNHLFTNNTAGISLSNNLSVSGTHTFVNGLLSTSSTPNYLVYETGSSYTGSDDTRHVTGWVKKIGSTDFVFPVGSTSYLRTVAVSSLSASAEFNCQYNTPTQNIYNLFSPLVQVKANEYWQLDKVSGGTAIVTLNWDHSKVPMDNILLKDILVGNYAGGNWTDAGGSETAVGLVTATGYVNSNAVTTFGPFTFGYKTFPVPLRWIDFNATRQNSISFLHWVTDNEQSVSHFDIQRSYDATNFSTIGRVNARNNGIREQYNFQDPTFFNGIAWYRIRSVDVDGRPSYTKIASVSNITASSVSFVVINPVRNTLTLVNKTGREGSFVCRLFNSSGQMVFQSGITTGNNAAASIALPGNVSGGIYVLEITNGIIQFKQQVLIER